MTRKHSIRGALASFQGGELKVVLAWAPEERTYFLNVSRWVEVEDNHIVEVGR